MLAKPDHPEVHILDQEGKRDHMHTSPQAMGQLPKVVSLEANKRSTRLRGWWNVM